MIPDCDEFKGKTRERCGKPARWLVVSGPCFVCWPHAVRLRAEGEEVVRGFFGWG